MLSTRDQHDVMAVLIQAAADHPAHGTRTEHDESHLRECNTARSCVYGAASASSLLWNMRALQIFPLRSVQSIAPLARTSTPLPFPRPTAATGVRNLSGPCAITSTISRWNLSHGSNISVQNRRMPSCPSNTPDNGPIEVDQSNSIALSTSSSAPSRSRRFQHSM